jgi:hypothetical protein
MRVTGLGGRYAVRGPVAHWQLYSVRSAVWLNLTSFPQRCHLSFSQTNTLRNRFESDLMISLIRHYKYKMHVFFISIKLYLSYSQENCKYTSKYILGRFILSLTLYEINLTHPTMRCGVQTARYHKLILCSKTSAVIAGLHPQTPSHFAWQPSAWVSQTLRPSYLSHMIAAAT